MAGKPTCNMLCIALIVTLILQCITASLVGTTTTNFEYTPTAEEIETYKAQLELDVYTLQSSSGHCESFSSSICSDLIPFGTSVYVPDSLTQSDLAQQLENSLFLLRVAKDEQKCGLALFSFLCSKFFPLCTVESNVGTATTTDDATAVAAYSNPPCYPICKTFNESCPELVDRFVLIPEELRPICADPTETRCGFHIDSQVTAFHAPIQKCPSPLVDVNDPSIAILEGSCAEPCPVLMWSRDEYRSMDVMSEILGIVSLLSSLFITITWLVFPKLRQKQYIFFFFVCSFFLSLFLWIGLRLRGSDIAAAVHCKTSTKEYQMEGYCLFQGMTTIFFLISGTAWWLCQASDIFMKVVLEMRFLDKSTQSRVKTIGFHVFSWGIGAICTIGGLGAGQIGGYGNGASFCLFSTERGVNKSPDVSYGFFYYPLIIMTALGVLAISATFVKLLLFKFSTKSGIGVSSFIRIAILVFAMLGVCIIIVLYKFMGADRVNIWRQSAEEFYQCLLFARDNPYEAIDCGDSPKERMPIGLKFLYDLIPLAPGLLAFMCYGSTATLYTPWLGLMYDTCGLEVGKKYSPKREATGGSYNSDVSKTDKTNASQTAGGQSKISRTAATTTAGGGGQTQANSAADAKKKMFGNNRRPQGGAASAVAAPKTTTVGNSVVGGTSVTEFPSSAHGSTVEMNSM